MENQNDVSASQSTMPNINVKTNIKSFSKIAYYVFHISNFTSLLSAIILVLTYGTGSPFQTVRYLFTSLTSIVHASSIIIYFCDFLVNNKKEENTNLQTENINKSILSKFILCADVHYLSILLMFSYAKITPILYVFCYIINFSLNFVNSTINDILPLLGPICAPQSLPETPSSPPPEETKNDLLSALDPLKKATNSMIIKILPVIFQMIISIQIIIITLFDMNIFNLLMCITYIVWGVMFDYATNAVYHDVWVKIGNKINEFAESNMETYGNVLSMLVKGFSKIGFYANQWYK